MSQLLSAQQKFAEMSVSLYQFILTKGWKFTYGETYRSPAKAEENAASGIGIANSLHTLKLAVDLNIFIADKMCDTFEDFRPVGEYWESLGGSWGGRFKNQDCDHFSLSFNGVR